MRSMGRKTCDVGCEKLDGSRQMSDGRIQTWDVGCEKLDGSRQISDGRIQTWDVRREFWVVGSEFGCSTHNKQPTTHLTHNA